ncbi:MAG: HAMP domain-containing histidine kinase [Arcobacter butzleri]|nr:HAMP domain-containing histidine kinase [Aliarcobacter butzleri]
MENMIFDRLRVYYKKADKTTATLIKRHMTFFILISLMIIFSFGLLYMISHIHKHDTYHINLSGKQRMLTQKASYLAMKIEKNNNTQDKKELFDLVITMIKNHYFLSKEVVVYDQKTIENITYHLDELYSLARGFLDNVSPKDIDYFIEINQDLLMMFDRLTTLKEEKINEIFFQSRVLIAIFGFLLLTLVTIKAFFIFRPAIISIIKQKLKLQTLNKQLSKRVAHEVARQKEQEMLLIQKSKEAQVGELINNIAHQWRQPLSIIKLYIMTLKQEYSNNILTQETFDELSKKSETLIDYMSQTIDDFRDFFIPSSESKVFNVIDSIKKIEKLLEHMFLFENITIDNRFDSYSMNQAFIKGKQNDLEHCLMILLVNSKEAIIERREKSRDKTIGNISVFVKILNDNVIIQIKDDGGGIPVSIRNNIFKQYFTSKKDTGTGVGLHMCKNIINNNYQGDIEFFVEKEFTTFSIKIPLIKEVK